MAASYFIGLMSGTSLDGVDASLLAFDDGDGDAHVVASQTQAFPPDLRRRLNTLCQATAIDVGQLAAAELALSQVYAQAVAALLLSADLDARLVTAIGSHGQTIRHLPEQGFSWQIGQPARLANLSGIPVVSDFRSSDIALGGQGAPLAPLFHQAFFHHPERPRMVINIGGMANVSLLPRQGPLQGWDTGPGNRLLDEWHARHHPGQHWDEGGRWARSGKVDSTLLEQLLSDSYFSRPPPKSTGPEHFNLEWLTAQLPPSPALRNQDVQATLLALTATTLADAVKEHAVEEVVVTGGGVFNDALMEALQSRLPDHPFIASASLGIPPDQVESAGFAWLARQRWLARPLPLGPITGARQSPCLGAVYLPARPS